RSSAIQDVRLRVNQAPAITSADHVLSSRGQLGTFTFTAAGFPAPTFTTASTLPAGITLGSDGVLSGTTTQTGPFSLTVTATNGVGQDATQDFTLRVGEPPSFTSADAPTFTVGQAGSFAVAASGVPGPPLSLTGGTPPSGVDFDPATGLLSGTPAAGTGGEYGLAFRATNGVAPDAAQTFTLVVDEAPAITSAD